MKYYIHTIIHLALFAVYFILAIIGFDATSWYLMNILVLVGVVGPALLWDKTKFKIIGFGIAYLKSALIILATYSWWKLTYSGDLIEQSSAFFWGMPPFLLVLGIFETLIITTYIDNKH